jgi:hypothetical protein
MSDMGAEEHMHQPSFVEVPEAVVAKAPDGEMVVG